MEIHEEPLVIHFIIEYNRRATILSGKVTFILEPAMKKKIVSCNEFGQFENCNRSLQLAGKLHQQHLPFNFVAKSKCQLPVDPGI